MSTYDELKRSVTAWAGRNDDVRAAVAAGSRTRRDHPADEWSDLDVLLYVRDPDALLEDVSWVDQIAPSLIVNRSRTAAADDELLVVFENGGFVDFVTYDERSLAAFGSAASLPASCLRGFEVLVDKGSKISLAGDAVRSQPYAAPTAEEFGQLLSGLWYGSLYAAKQLRRGDLWRVKLLDSQTLAALTRLMEVHARVTKGWDTDTWHMGRFMEKWLDPEIAIFLGDLHAGWDIAQSWGALLSRMDVVRTMGTAIASGLGFQYPQDIDERVSEFVLGMYLESVDL